MSCAQCTLRCCHLQLALITPYLPETLSGNDHIAVRWRGFLRAAGQRVDMATQWDGSPVDAMIALHARRSAESIAALPGGPPDRPRRHFQVCVAGHLRAQKDPSGQPMAQHSLRKTPACACTMSERRSTLK